MPDLIYNYIETSILFYSILFAFTSHKRKYERLSNSNLLLPDPLQFLLYEIPYPLISWFHSLSPELVSFHSPTLTSHHWFTETAIAKSKLSQNFTNSRHKSTISEQKPFTLRARASQSSSSGLTSLATPTRNDVISVSAKRTRYVT